MTVLWMITKPLFRNVTCFQPVYPLHHDAQQHNKHNAPGMIYEARKNAQSNKCRDPQKKDLCIVWSIVATPQSGKFSGIIMKGWEMDEERRRERLGGGVSESRERERTFQISHSEIGFCSTGTIDTQSWKENEGE